MIAPFRVRTRLATRPYRPTIQLPAALSPDVINRFATPREALGAWVEGLGFTIGSSRVVLDGSAADGSSEVVFRVARIGELALRLPGRAVSRVLAQMEGEAAALPEDAVALLLELALAPLLDGLEAMGCPPVEIVAVRSAPSALDSRPRLAFDAELDGEPFSVSLPFDPAEPNAIEFLLRLLGMAPLRPAPLLGIPLPLAFVVGDIRLTVEQVRGMRAGDALVPDTWHPARHEAVVRLGDRFAARASLHGSAIALTTGFQPHMQDQAGSEDGAGYALDGSDAPRPGDFGGGLDSVGVTLSFELGRRTVEIGELRQVGPGYVFELNGSGSVDIVANGARIGQGEIVEVGERLAVRLVRLFGAN